MQAQRSKYKNAHVRPAGLGHLLGRGNRPYSETLLGRVRLPSRISFLAWAWRVTLTVLSSVKLRMEMSHRQERAVQRDPTLNKTY